MSYLTILFSPLNLLFFIIITGFAIGRIRIKGISLDIAGILFASIFIGILINLWVPDTYTPITTNVQDTMKTFSKLGTALFISVIGLQTGFSIKNHSNSSILSFAVGALMSLSGVTVMLVISALDKTVHYTSLLGILCGALTSTPGLSSVCELLEDGSENAVWGYGCAYLFGVILVVLFVQLCSPKNDEQTIRAELSHEPRSKIYPELMLLCLTALTGNMIGNIKIPFFNISLGTTASTLIVGLFIGLIVAKLAVFKILNTQCLNAFKSLGLSLFFTGTGYTTGTQAMEFHFKTVLYGILITLCTMLCGYILCKIIPSRIKYNVHFIIAGGMTSSPAYGAINAQTNKFSTSHFSFAYFGALTALIFAIQVIIP